MRQIFYFLLFVIFTIMPGTGMAGDFLDSLNGYWECDGKNSVALQPTVQKSPQADRVALAYSKSFKLLFDVQAGKLTIFEGNKRLLRPFEVLEETPESVTLKSDNGLSYVFTRQEDQSIIYRNPHMRGALFSMHKTSASLTPPPAIPSANSPRRPAPRFAIRPAPAENSTFPAIPSTPPVAHPTVKPPTSHMATSPGSASGSETPTVSLPAGPQAVPPVNPPTTPTASLPVSPPTTPSVAPPVRPPATPLADTPISPSVESPALPPVRPPARPPA